MLERAKKVMAVGVSPEFSEMNYLHAMFYSNGKASGIYDVDCKEYINFTWSQRRSFLGLSHPGTLAAVNAYTQQGEQQNPYERMYGLAQPITQGLRKTAAKNKKQLLGQGPGAMFNITITKLEVISDYRDTLDAGKQQLKKFIDGMHTKGVRVFGRRPWFISAAHTQDDILEAIDIADQVLSAI
jgi:glutamate-1-semialdehyde aminotransferase